ncbi:hypothetical protein VTL71DRAFT_15912 [Oculimacula yallundae]|uniref:Tyrosinase copper-binding domain-containing protein n=1 Tax=Oculimacula yallundae TaxID=86028 RepID=A0ABR4CF27_9HELO
MITFKPEDEEIEDTHVEKNWAKRRSSILGFGCLFTIGCFLILLWTAGFIATKLSVTESPGPIHMKPHHSYHPHQAKSCLRPAVRREWRTLSIKERKNYLDAIQCLWKHPSRLGLNHSLYEDFPWFHSRAGNFSHNTPAFMAWHRYFLDVYERTLKETCGYQGYLTYWDWSLDWQNMTSSPIWDPETGFGGNGNKTAHRSVGHGHCVTDGPLAGRRFKYFGNENIKHCLSRGFISDRHMMEVFGSKVRLESVERVLKQPTYEKFNKELEDGPHNALPRTIRGDFMRVTVPNDPIFFIHHVQLDRLWWQWQQRAPKERTLQYATSEEEPRGHILLREVFPFEPLARDRQVWEVMDTESDVLCYRY